MRKKHEPERTERTLRPMGQSARKGRRESSRPLLSGETTQKTGKRARHKKYRRQIREQQAAETVQETAAE